MKNNMLHRVALVALPALVVLVAAVVAFSPEPAVGTTEYMTRLPTYSNFQCAICHTVDKPVASDAPLNSFGVDFKANDYKWDEELAQKNSDGDKCPNGFELDDINGDGMVDEPAGEENSNPGVPDCTITLSKQTWGIIKELFSEGD